MRFDHALAGTTLRNNRYNKGCSVVMLYFIRLSRHLVLGVLALVYLCMYGLGASRTLISLYLFFLKEFDFGVHPIHVPSSSTTSPELPKKMVAGRFLRFLWLASVCGVSARPGHFLGITAPRQTSTETVAASDDGPTVDLGYATYRGIRLEDAGVDEYLGMRYAQAPLGNLRFRAPQDPLTETGISDATQVSLKSNLKKRLVWTNIVTNS